MKAEPAIPRISRQRVVAGMSTAVLKLRGPHPIRMDHLAALRKLAGGPDPLYPKFAKPQKGSALNNAFLAEMLKDIEFGLWSMSTETLNFFETLIGSGSSQTLLELGGGLSTVCLARYVAETGGQASHIVSVEQSEEFQRQTMAMLDSYGLSSYVSCLVAPLGEQEVMGVRTICYLLNPAAILTATRGNMVDLGIIDGPSGPPGVRFATLPLMLPLLAPTARFFLDDALRDAEFEIAKRWSRMEGVEIEGIALLGTGLLTGRVTAT